jgi:hypothetical protein
MASLKPDQLDTAHHLRRKAKRYRDLAITNGDERDVAIMRTLSREIDEEAAQIEQEVLEQIAPCKTQHDDLA